MNQPGITVVTPSLNQAKYIGACLESVRKQGFSDIEHLVIDGGSSDETRKIVEAFDHATFIDLPKSSQSKALNWGFENAKYPIICWLNSDDVLLEGAFDLVLKKSKSLGPKWYIFSSFVEINSDDKVGLVRLVPIYIEHAIRNCATYIPTSGSFFSNTIAADKLLLVDDLHYLMDRDFMIRLSSAGYRISRSRQLLAGFRIHEEQKSVKGGANEGQRSMERSSIGAEHGGLWLGGKRLVRHNKALEFAYKVYIGGSWKSGRLVNKLPISMLSNQKHESQVWIDSLQQV